MEGDAGARQLNPTDETPDESVAASEDADQDAAEPAEAPESRESAGAARRPSRLGRDWVLTICVTFGVLAAAMTAGGVMALRAHQDGEATARADAAALDAAKECVSATHAPDTAAMSAAQAKIIECSTGDFGAQATLYSGVLVDAYRAANVQVQVSDMRAAVEKHHVDGTVDVLVAVRVKVTNAEAADQEQGYRLRVQMAPVEGTYKVARLDQVTS